MTRGQKPGCIETQWLETVTRRDHDAEDESIVITDRAAMQLKTLKQRAAMPVSYGLRCSISSSGSGLSYVFGFDKQQSDDAVLEASGIDVFVRKDRVSDLLGAKLDYRNQPEKEGFIFTSPVAARRCGCAAALIHGIHPVRA